MGVLDEILESKRRELPELRRRRLPNPPPARPVSLRRTPGGAVSLIAEIKRRSPSAGTLSTALSVSERAAAYAAEGAAAISVLCDGPFFAGDYAHLGEARDAGDVPILCKEFVLDEIQLDAARAFGADMVLLIVRCLEPARLTELVREAKARDLVPLVEIHSTDDAAIAIAAGAEVVGVNARDLDTLRMNVAGARAVLESLGDARTRIHLSGLATAEDVRRVAQTPADGALVGEALMRCDDPRPLLKQLIAAARG